MTEFVCELTDARYEMDWTPKEEIVRCRDCRFFRIGLNTDSCAFTDKYARADGFCAWGERRNQDEDNG